MPNCPKKALNYLIFYIAFTGGYISTEVSNKGGESFIGLSRISLEGRKVGERTGGRERRGKGGRENEGKVNKKWEV